MKFKNNILIPVFFCINTLSFVSCNKSDSSSVIKTKQQHTIYTQPIYSTNVDLKARNDSNIIGYHCTALTSKVICNIYPNNTNHEAKAELFDKEGHHLTTIFFKLKEELILAGLAIWD